MKKLWKRGIDVVLGLVGTFREYLDVIKKPNPFSLGIRKGVNLKYKEF